MNLEKESCHTCGTISSKVIATDYVVTNHLPTTKKTYHCAQCDNTFAVYFQFNNDDWEENIKKVRETPEGKKMTDEEALDAVKTWHNKRLEPTKED